MFEAPVISDATSSDKHQGSRYGRMDLKAMVQYCFVGFFYMNTKPGLPAFELCQPHCDEALVVPCTAHLRNAPTDLHLMNI